MQPCEILEESIESNQCVQTMENVFRDAQVVDEQCGHNHIGMRSSSKMNSEYSRYKREHNLFIMISMLHT